MNEQYLFGAEVNKIQDTLFRASKQRQVVGGSRLLAVFGDIAEQVARERYGAQWALVKDGGNFRILFSDPAMAKRFGAHLADSYHLLLDGSMTIAPPEPVEAPLAEHFGRANKKLRAELAKLKRSQWQAVDSAQAPTVAYCQSSGVGLAVTYGSPTPPESEQYLSAFARDMGRAGWVTKEGSDGQSVDDKDDSFLDRIAAGLDGKYRDWQWARRPEEIQTWDPTRSNIAYLVADGNNMGRFFDQCADPGQLAHLSDRLTKVTYTSIARATSLLLNRLLSSGLASGEEVIPVLPLIAAGDDVFIMLPAPYALDFGRAFCLEFERQMQADEVVQALTALSGEQGQRVAPPTMSAAVVLCKAKYPYHLAHGYGESLLQEVKRVVKTAGRETGHWFSAMAFDIIIGSELVTRREKRETDGGGLTTYWLVGDERSLPPSMRQSAIDLRLLLDQRLVLRQLPSKRRAEIRELFDGARQPDDEHWNGRLARLLQRLAVTDPDAGLDAVLHDGLAILGNAEADPRENPGRWLKVDRSGKKYWGHGMSDLLAIWDYAQRLDVDLGEYAKEREL